MLAENLTTFLEQDVWSAVCGVGPVEVDFDLTAVGQAALFLFLMLALKPLLFTPMLRLFEEREKRIDGAKEEARRLDDASAESLARYESALHEAKLAATLERERLRDEGIKTASEILHRARAATADYSERRRKEAHAYMTEARKSLHDQTRTLATQAVSKVLERKIPV